MTLNELIWHRLHFEHKDYLLSLKRYVRARGLNPDNDEAIAEALRKTSCLIGTKPGRYDVDLGIQANRVRQYYNIHKSKTVRDAWLLLIANQDSVFECDFAYLNRYFFQN